VAACREAPLGFDFVKAFKLFKNAFVCLDFSAELYPEAALDNCDDEAEP